MEYTSNQQQIRRSPEQIYGILSKFSNFTPMLEGKVDKWEATETTCSFTVQGFKFGLKMAELEPFTKIKITTDGDNAPMTFALWVQLKEVEPYDTRLRLVLDVELNMMMKMMIGSKIQDGLDKVAEQIAAGLNTQL